MDFRAKNATNARVGRGRARFRVSIGLLLLSLTIPALPGSSGAAANGLIAAYSFDEGSGASAGDATGTGHAAALTNATWAAAGHAGAALSFNGTNAWATVADAADLRLTTGMTIEAWVRPASQAGWRTVVMKERPGGLSYALYSSDDSNRPPAGYGNTGGSDTAAVGSAAIPLNAWVHLAATYDGSALRLYVGGALAGTTPLAGSLLSSTSPLRIGGNGVWGEYFSGLIDDVRVYNRPLGQAEIASDMNSPVAPPAPDTTPPTVTLTAPADGATVEGSVPVSANASDNIGVAGVQFLLDGAALGAEDLVAPYAATWNTTTATTGSHTLAARARDGSGLTTTSVAASVSVVRSNDTTPPSVSITSPTPGSTVSGSVTVSASASDNTGVTGVQFLVDSAFFGAVKTAAPYTTSWDTTAVANGAHTVAAQATDAAGNATTSASVPVTVSNSDPRAVTGQWAAPVDVATIMQHATLLPGTSKILFFQDGASARVLDMATGSITAAPAASNLFCAGHAFLADGRPVTIGGDTAGQGAVGIVDTNVFNPATNSWSRVADMKYARWYPNATLLPNGNILALSGSYAGCLTCYVQTPEMYNPAGNTWTSMPSADRNIPYYPFVYVLPDGRVIQAGSSEQATSTQVLDLQTQTWSTVDSRVIDAGSATMYQPGKILKAGTASDGNSAVRPSSPNSYVLDMLGATPSWRQVASMANGRAFLNLTTLPDGNVLATGGTATADGTNASNAVKAAELWSPVTEQWTTLASAQKPRSYHSMAMLLPDGRVLIGGGGNDGAVPNEANYEIFSPPYLFKGPRPVITTAPSTVTYGQTFSVTTPDAARVTSARLVAPASVTHAFDEHARTVPLSVAQSGGSVQLTAPASANVAPPGYYMLFLVDSAGVPSVASWVRVPAATEDAVAPSAPGTLTASGGLGGASLAWGAATDNVGVTGYVIHRSTAPGFTPGPGNQVGQSSATTFADNGLAAGTYYYRVVAKDAAGNSGAASNEASAVVTGDSAAPTVALTAPAGGATISGSVSVAATASDNVGVTGVQFLLDGAALGARVLSPPYQISWNTAGVANGTHALGAQAFDAAGNTGTAGTRTVTVSNAAPTGISVDTTVFRDVRGTAVTPSFSTTAPGEVLLAFVGADGPLGQAQTATVSGAGLTWMLVRRTNTRAGTSEVWRASAPGTLSNVTVQSVLGSAGFDQSLTVVALNGAAGVGTSAGASAATGAPSVGLTTTGQGSVVFGVGNDWDDATARTVGAGQAMVHQWVDTAVGDTFWTQRIVRPVTNAGTAVTVNDTAPANHRWNLTAVEVLAR